MLDQVSLLGLEYSIDVCDLLNETRELCQDMLLEENNRSFNFLDDLNRRVEP